MTRTITALVLIGLATGAAAQSAGTIPIERDLRRHDRIEQDIRRHEQVQRMIQGYGDETGSVRRPGLPVQSDPSGVAGFNGPPGTVGDSVGSYGPLPPGAPGNDAW